MDGSEVCQDETLQKGRRRGKAARAPSGSLFRGAPPYQIGGSKIMARPKVVVVGGGLAGLVAAWKLLESGCDVTIFEASGRWGGKAGATECDGQFEEHGYHIFPGWYRNIWQIIDELGLRESFRDCSQF